jgi:hypothetical protein
MTQSPTLAETLAIRPEQLTGLTPVEVDRYNAVLWTEYARLAAAIDKAADGIHSALLQRKKSERHGRGYTQVWPTTFAEALRTAQEHLTTGWEPDQATRVQHGLYREGAYAASLRKALDFYNALGAARQRLSDGPGAVLDGEFTRRGGWSRMYLCTSDGGHIHSGRQCPSIGPRTELAWLPDVSGMDWREAYKALPQNLSAGSPAIMCTKCYPDAPVDWTVKQADPTVCPGSGKSAWEHMTEHQRGLYMKYGKCPYCPDDADLVSVTSGWKFRKHKTAAQAAPVAEEQPAPPAPKAAAPKLTPTQQSALDLMRSRHTGMIHSGEGFAITTVDALARHGLCTVEKSRRADGVLRTTAYTYFEATLTDKGWEGHERPAEPGPAYGEPTPNDELGKGDRVINIHTGSEGVWQGPSQLGGWSVREDIGATFNIHAGGGDHWRLLERAPEAPAEPVVEPQEAASAPAEDDVPLDQDKPVTHAYGPAGVRYEPGMRVTRRGRDGMWEHGEVTEVFEAAHTREPRLRFTVDAYQAAPPRRKQKWMDNKPGKRRSTEPRSAIALVADKDLSPEIIA